MRRICYIHVGPPKTGTSSIQEFLKENNEALLREGYFVPGSGAKFGAQHWLVRQLCGKELRAYQQAALPDFTKALAETPSDAVVLSSESLYGLLQVPEYAQRFFDGIAAHDLEPQLVFFARHQPAWLNSRYSQRIKSFQSTDAFSRFAQERIAERDIGYLSWIELANRHNAKLIACPFTAATMKDGVVRAFLTAIGLDRHQPANEEIRRNESVGPFRISVSRRVLRRIGGVERLNRVQARRLRNRLERYLSERGIADSGYCGLTTASAEQIEQACATDNEAFAQQMWNASWREIFAADIGKEYTPNDFTLVPPSGEVRLQLRQAIDEVSSIASSVLSNPKFSDDSP